MLAHALKTTRPEGLELLALGHTEFDLGNTGQMAGRLDEWRPQVVINTAAYNLVDRCEVERELSWRINATGTQELAQLCSARSCQLIHFSTDYVFDGEKRLPYLETDAVNPLNHYGQGKLSGEQAVLRADPRHLVVRTSWLFGEHPKQTKTYIHLVLRAVAEGKALKAAHDQHSVPTYAFDLAGWFFEMIRVGARGLYHGVNDEGVSRYDWTRVIIEEARAAGLIDHVPEVAPVPSSAFNPTMRRPAYTVLSNEKLAGLLGTPLGSWRKGLRSFLAHWKLLAARRVGS